MDWLTCLNESLRYIENNLDGELDIGKAARIACCSGYHYQRMFSYMAGVSLSEYIRRRRMTKAALDLQNSNAKIIDIALKYSYDSPTAFNRAFQSVHGAPPSAARQDGVQLKAYHPISFKISIRGEIEMNYRIEKRDAFRILGVKTTASNSPDCAEAFTSIPKFWQEAHQNGIVPQIAKCMDAEPMGLLGISVGNCQNDATFDYYIAAASTGPVPEGMVEYQVPASTWAIFECIGPMPTAIQELSQRIMTEWLPNSGYQYADAPDIEQYTDGDTTAKDYVCWIWVPIKK